MQKQQLIGIYEIMVRRNLRNYGTEKLYYPSTFLFPIIS